MGALTSIRRGGAAQRPTAERRGCASELPGVNVRKRVRVKEVVLGGGGGGGGGGEKREALAAAKTLFSWIKT